MVRWFQRNDARSLTEILQPTEREVEMHTDAYMLKVAKLEAEFKYKTKLNDVDMTFLFLGAAIQVLRWSLVTNNSFRFQKDGDSEALLRKFANNDITQKILPATITDILTDPTVPYDAFRYTENFTKNNPDFSTGISGANHRYTTLGHDPLAGLLFGTANIVTNTLCVNKIFDFDFIPSYTVLNKKIDGRTNVASIMDCAAKELTNEPQKVGVAFLKQIVHAGTDVFTKQGLPLPFINSVSPDASKWLIGHNIDLYSVTRAVALAMTINKIVEMTHKLFFDAKRDDKRIYEAKTMKVVMYSNILSSLLNIGYVTVTQDYNRLDVGGIAVALFKLLTTPSKIREIKMEFIDKVLSEEYSKQEDEINQQLARFGYHI